MSDDVISVLVPLGAFALVMGFFTLWVWAMVNAAKNGKWVWFVMVLLFSPLLLLIYLIFGYERRPARERAVQGYERREPGSGP